MVPVNGGWPLLFTFLYYTPTCPSGQTHDKTTGNCISTPVCDSTHCTETTVNLIKNNGEPSGDLCGGNPINFGTGNKYQLETDYQGAGDFPLVFERTYNSETSTFSERVGPNWRHSYERSIVSTGNSNLVVAYRPDGRAYYFSFVGTHWLPVADVNLQLSGSSSTDWQLTTEDNGIETYDANGRLQSIKSRGGATHTLTYDASGLLTTVTHSNGRRLTLSYDSGRRVISVQNPSGGLYRYGYNTAGNLETVIYPDLSQKTYLYNETANMPTGVSLPHALTGIIDENNSRFASWTYDTKGRAISSQHAGGAEAVSVSYGTNSSIVTDALGTARTHSLQIVQGVAKSGGQSQPPGAGCAASASNVGYDTHGNISSRTDFNGNLSCFAYDLNRNLETARLEGLAPGSICPADLAAYTPAADSNERKIITQWHAGYRLPNQIDQAGQRLNFYYDDNGNLLQKSLTDTVTQKTRSWSYTYNQIGQVLTEDGPRTDIDDITTYSYYSDSTSDHKPGDLWKITNALGHVITFTAYDGNGRLLSLVDPNGLVIGLNYDLRGRLTQKTVDGNTTRYDYDTTGNLVKITQPTGVALGYSYDAAHRLTDITDSLGNQIHYSLDLMGNRIKEEIFDASGTVVNSHSRQFDALSRLQKDMGAYNQTTNYQYDANGNLTQIIDANDHATQLAYDSLNRLSRFTDALTGLINFQYDSQDRVTHVIDAKLQSTVYSYNGLGDLTQLDSPNTGISQYRYDSAGNLAQKTDAGDVTARYSYDALNRLQGADYPGTEADTRYKYDTTPDSQAGQTGRLTEARRGDIVTRLDYDLRGNQTANTVQNSSTSQTISDIHYDYDADDRLTNIHPTATSHIQYQYDIAGQIQRIDLVDANGTTTLANSIRHLPFGPVQQLRYGNRLDLRRSYDQDYRLIQESIGDIHHLNYSYQADGQLTQLLDAIDGNQHSFGYNPLHRLSTVTSNGQTSRNQEYLYDPVGNRTELHGPRTTTRYSYAPDSQKILDVSIDHRKPTSYISNPQGNVSQIGDLALNYSADQRLSNIQQIKSKKHSTELARYRYDAQGQRIAKTTTKGTTYYAYNLDQQLLSEGADNPSHYVYLEGQPLARIDGTGELYYFHNNHLGAPLKVSDQTGQLAWSAEPDPFGQTTPINPDITQNVRFPGQYYDQETGWHYNMQRYYDPKLGRYLQSDPVGLAGGINEYAYALNNPLNLSDRDGRGAFLPLLAALGSAALDFYALQTAATDSVPSGVTGKACSYVKGIKTPYGIANQSQRSAALSARQEVDNGATLYRLGTTGKSEAAEAQFWALEHPLTYGYAQRYGIPYENILNADFIEAATLKPGTPFITRPAPGIGENIGGGIEVIVPSGGVQMKWFSGETK
ncbi:MAG: RHS repeat-associated core domain-containing protein [Methylomonas sp.]